MSDNFTDNQTITAADLNNIARDMGATDFSYFTDGVPYAVDELNQITDAILTAGVIGTGSPCKVTYSDADHTATVAAGTVIFGNGAKKKIDVDIPIPIEDDSGCIYAVHTDDGKMLIRCADVFPEKSDYVIWLGEISNGTTTDRRVYSHAKVEVPALSSMYEYEKTCTLSSHSTTIDTLGIEANYECMITTVSDKNRGLQSSRTVILTPDIGTNKDMRFQLVSGHDLVILNINNNNGVYVLSGEAYDAPASAEWTVNIKFFR